MSRVVLITVCFHDRRYHGSGDGPPSPSRIFQALLAGAGLSGPLTEIDLSALTWLEDREPPLIGTPVMLDGQGFATYFFSKPPEPRFAQVPYDSPPSRRLYELREGTSEALFGVWPLERAQTLVVWMRDGAVAKLRDHLPNRASDIERVLVGRKAGGADDAPSSSRVRIVPLPSIGHHHADRGIRRVRYLNRPSSSRGRQSRTLRAQSNARRTVAGTPSGWPRAASRTSTRASRSERPHWAT
jgi:CRISPR-associated protein Csb2